MLNIFANSMLTATRIQDHTISDVRGKTKSPQKRSRWWNQTPKSTDLKNL
ncbi:hypothetical protein [Parasedimentitalea denitrificans]|nr:hypothetical protein [Sedimentitalea sp. CY04]